MKDYNPEMVLFLEISSMIWPVLALYNLVNYFLLSKGIKIGHPGRYLGHIKYVNYAIWIFRIALMSYGIHFSWTAEQAMLRSDSDPVVSKAAKDIEGIVSVLILIVGLIYVILMVPVILCCFCNFVFNRENM